MNIPEATAIKLERGGIYVIEMQYRFRTQEEFANWQVTLNARAEKLGVSFIVLEPGAKIARAEECSERERQLEERPDYMHRSKA